MYMHDIIIIYSRMTYDMYPVICTVYRYIASQPLSSQSLRFSALLPFGVPDATACYSVYIVALCVNLCLCKACYEAFVTEWRKAASNSRCSCVPRAGRLPLPAAGQSC